MKKPPVVVPISELYAPVTTTAPNSSREICRTVEGTFTILVVSVMLESHDPARRPTIRSDQSTPPQNRDHCRHRCAPHRSVCRLAISLLARGVDRWQFLQGSPEAGLQHRLRHLDARSELVETPG